MNFLSQANFKLCDIPQDPKLKKTLIKKNYLLQIFFASAKV